MAFKRFSISTSGIFVSGICVFCMISHFTGELLVLSCKQIVKGWLPKASCRVCFLPGGTVLKLSLMHYLRFLAVSVVLFVVGGLPKKLMPDLSG